MMEKKDTAVDMMAAIIMMMMMMKMEMFPRNTGFMESKL